MTAVPAAAIARALKDNLLGVPEVSLQHLLYLAQGHHLGWFGRPLFADPIVATDRGPDIADLEAAGDGSALGDVELNTVGFVCSRYGNLSPRDLSVLVRAQSPYQLAEVDRQPGQMARIDVEVMRRHFAAAAAAERRETGIPEEAVSALVAGARERLAVPLRPDDLEELRAREHHVS